MAFDSSGIVNDSMNGISSCSSENLRRLSASRQAMITVSMRLGLEEADEPKDDTR